MRYLLCFALMFACAEHADAPIADSAAAAREDDGWSPCVGARPSGCGRCPEGQQAKFKGVPPNRQFGCFDRATGERMPGVPGFRTFAGRDGGVLRDDNGRAVK